MDQIIIDLQNSSNARVFKDLNVIHKSAFESVESLLLDFQREHLERSDDRVTLTYKHNTITILGTRGSGKTSFLLSIEEVIKTDKKKYGNLLFLEMIDPTLVEEKGHIFLNVISVICEKVKIELEAKEVEIPNNTQCIKKEWKESLNKLAKGLPVIDGIGGNKFGEWQDAEFVMNNELQAINSARNLAKCFAEFVKHSLKILDKKQFVLFFDDIDVDSTKGYAVLETIRKYFISDQIITFLSGDLKLYDALVREKKWSNFGTNLINYEVSLSYQSEEKQKVNMMHYNDMVTDLTSQYLIKIMQPKYRIHLSTLYEYYRKNQSKISVSKYTTDKKDTETIELEEFLKVIFKKYGIKSDLQRATFVEFLLKQPLRTAVHFLQYFNRKKENTDDTDFVSVFLSDLYEKHIDIDLIQESTTYFLPIVLRLLIQEEKLTESYQLMPSSLDNSLNASLFTTSLLLSHHINRGNRFLIFEYFLKISYLRNFAEKEKNDKNFIPILDNAGVFNDSVLRDCINRLQSGLYSHFHELKSSEFGMIPLYGLAKTSKISKKESLNRIDSIFDQTNVHTITKMLGYLPCFITQYTYKQSTNIFYSIISLFSSIGELSKRFTNNVISKDNLYQELFELSQLRYYSVNSLNRIPREEIESVVSEQDNQNDTSDLPVLYDGESLDKFADYLLNWFRFSIESISPYLLGKIFTRFYFSLKGITPDNLNLGEIFNLQILSFFNAVIVEEARELNLKIILNNNNIQASTSVFINNYNKISENMLFEDMILSRWFLSCPLLVMYLDEQSYQLISTNSTLENMNLEDYKKLEVNSLLKNILVAESKSQIASNKKSINYSHIENKKLNDRSAKTKRNRDAFEKLQEKLNTERDRILNFYPPNENFSAEKVNTFFRNFKDILDNYEFDNITDKRRFVKKCVNYLKNNLKDQD